MSQTEFNSALFIVFIVVFALVMLIALTGQRPSGTDRRAGSYYRNPDRKSKADQRRVYNTPVTKRSGREDFTPYTMTPDIDVTRSVAEYKRDYQCDFASTSDTSSTSSSSSSSSSSCSSDSSFRGNYANPKYQS